MTTATANANAARLPWHAPKVHEFVDHTISPPACRLRRSTLLTARRTHEWRQRKRNHKKDPIEYVNSPHKQSTLLKLATEIESSENLSKLGWRKAMERHIMDIVERAVSKTIL